MQLITINGVRGYIDENGTARLNLEDVARGLGFTTVARSGNEVVRWNRVNEYLTDLGFSHEVGKDTYIAENIFYRLAMKAKNETAEAFQAKVADEILPSIRKHGAYLTPAKVEEVLSDPDTIIRLAMQLKQEREEKRLLAEENERKQTELDYKSEVIIGLVDEIDLATKRQILNRVVRKGGAKFQERWSELYKQFEMKYHLRLSDHLERYNRTHKPKLKNKVDYIDKVMNKIPELYEIACKLFENDVKELVSEIYGLNSQ
ncbi:BRO-N domain-containing protein [Paenibacillus naphthalenovorans]|uniref:BRO-N domain-containing protein n=1 Tax=Paenibacillus naphthalenovorans TaxID=162209 RepID=UPI0008885735|nr:BRO family protein [Paenibacillus naphthalenovorans]SDK01745.1 Prophage antirepressor [Paenibacillus naphthalenovorans]